MSGGGRPQQDDEALVRRIAALRKAGASDNEVAQLVHERDSRADFSGVQGGSSTTATPLATDNLTNLAGEKVAAAVHGLAKGLTLGYSDKILGALTPHSIEEYQQRGRTLRERNPYTTGAADIAGGLATTLGTAGIGAAKGPVSLLNATGRAALGGAALGTVSGYGYAEGSQGDQALQAVGSGVAGGLLGAATPTVVRGATGLYRALTEKAGAKAARVAGEQAIAALQRDGYSVDDATRIVGELSGAGAGNKPAALIDLPNGENVRGAARGIHSQPGPGRQRIQGFTDARQAGQAARLQRDFTATSGTPAGSPSLEREAVLRARRAADAQNYGASVDAMGDTPITDLALNALIEDKPSLRAARRVARQAEEERIGSAAMAAREPAEAGTDVAAAAPTKPAKHYPYDAVRRQNGDMRPMSDLPKVTDEGLFNELSDLMDKQSEGQRRAQYRSTFDDDMQLQRTVATRKGGGPSEQAKAARNLDDWANRQDAIETELKRRGHTDESIADTMLAKSDPEAAAERAAEREGMQSDTAAPRAEGPTARELQRMKQALDKAITAGKLENPFAPGAQHSDAQALGQTRAQLVERMNANIPGYQAANEASAAGLGQAKAITLGARVFNKSPDAAGEAYRSLRSDAERAAFRRAYGQKYLEAIGGGRGSSDRAGAVFGTTGTVAGSETKLAQARMAFEDDATFQRFLSGLESEGKMTVGNRVTGNSNTASKLADQADLARAPVIKAALQLGQGNVGSALKALVAGGLESRAARLSEGSRAHLAEILTADPQTLAGLLNTASRRGRRSAANGQYLARALGALAGRTISQP